MIECTHRQQQPFIYSFIHSPTRSSTFIQLYIPHCTHTPLFISQLAAPSLSYQIIIRTTFFFSLFNNGNHKSTSPHHLVLVLSYSPTHFPLKLIPFTITPSTHFQQELDFKYNNPISYISNTTCTLTFYSQLT